MWLMVACGLFLVYNGVKLVMRYEHRKGVVLDDPMFPLLPVHSYNTAIALCQWLSIALMLGEGWFHRNLYTVIWKHTLIHVLRAIFMWSCPLAAPVGCLQLQDPVLQLVCKGGALYQDLMFSGHTATVALNLGLSQSLWCQIAHGVTLLPMCIMLLAQRVHYTVDILVALLAAYSVARVAT